MTRSVQCVESSLQATLFDRSGRPVVAAPGNEDFFYELHKGLYYLRRAFSRLKRNRRAAEAAIEVGYSSCFDVDLLTYLAHMCRASGQTISAVCHSSFTSEIVARVLDGVWDCGFVLKPAATFDLATIPIVRDRVGIVMANDHPLAKQQTICLRDLEREPLILPMAERNPALRHWFAGHCAAAGFHPWIVQEINHPHEANVFAAQRIGVAFATRSTARCSENDGIVFRPFAEKSLAIEMQMVMRGDADSGALRSYVALVMKMRDRMERKPGMGMAKTVLPMPENT